MRAISLDMCVCMCAWCLTACMLEHTHDLWLVNVVLTGWGLDNELWKLDLCHGERSRAHGSNDATKPGSRLFQELLVRRVPTQEQGYHSKLMALLQAHLANSSSAFISLHQGGVSFMYS